MSKLKTENIELQEKIENLTKELRESRDYITHLKHNLDRVYDDLEKTKEEAQDKIAELESELEVKENLLKIKNGLCGSFDCLPSEPISVGNMLINAKEEYEPTSLEKALCSNIKPLVDKYSIDDLEQIAEHLLVYCKHNKEDEE